MQMQNTVTFHKTFHCFKCILKLYMCVFKIHRVASPYLRQLLIAIDVSKLKKKRLFHKMVYAYAQYIL